MKRLFLVTLIAASLSAPAHAQNLIVGGDFEAPAIVEQKDGLAYQLNVTPAGWAGAGDVVRQGYAGAADSGNGRQWFDLNPDVHAGNGIMQSVRLVAGVTYTFSFRYNGGGGTTTAISFEIGDLVRDAVSTEKMSAYAGTAWKICLVTFTAKVTGPVDVRFAPNGRHAGGFIDDVQLRPVEGPAHEDKAISDLSVPQRINPMQTHPSQDGQTPTSVLPVSSVRTPLC